MDIKKRLILACSALAVIPLVAAMFTLERVAVIKASDAIEEAVSRQLISVASVKKHEIEEYFHTIESQCRHFLQAL
ncbi:MAG: hypothetical protein JKY14_12830 [Paraglaciecola sp.]|nr:hypothetical protein [Paraglaciecola sp.]